MKTSVRDIAKEANVSITTVSRYLNNDYRSMSETTRQRIGEVIKKREYVYKPKKKTNRRIGIVLPDLANPFFAQMANALEYAAGELNLDVQLALSHNDYQKERSHVERMVNNQIAGLIYMSTVSSQENCYGYLTEQKIPFVVLDSYLDEYSVPAAVYVDGKKAVYEISKHLIRCGHRSIAYISGLKYSSFGHDRYQGYTNALLEAGIRVDPELVRFCGFEAANGAESFLSLYQSSIPFTAVICENDMIAFGVANECSKMGIRIPDDLSVTGFDNTYMAAYFSPPLTSVEQHVGRQAEKAMELLLCQIKREPLQEKIVLIEPTLVMRKSVKDIGKANQ